jgi:hypothetical protein
MSVEQQSVEYARAVTPIERLFTWSPFSIVTMVARIRGRVSEGMLRGAVSKVRLRHPHLRVRMVAADGGGPWFTSDGAGDIPIDIVSRQSDDHWIRVVQESCQVPFDFEARPAIRFILVQSPGASELIILCHHILCDGLSLAYLARDLMVHLGDPARPVEPLPDPVPIERGNMPNDASANAVVRFFIRRMNKKWAQERLIFDQEDYRTLAEAYWKHYRHELLPVELSEAQTTALVERCRRKGVTVNSALTAAILGAQVMVQGEKPFHSSVGVAGSLRHRLRQPAGEVMGFYAGVVQFKWRYRANRGFWENAHRLHQKVRPLYTDKNLFADFVNWSYLDPTILEAINFKKLGGLVPKRAARHQKLSAFAARDDVVLTILKQDKMESLEKIIMGTAVTNLTRLDFPRRYGALELGGLIMKPGGAFPLANVNLVLGAVTCSGKLGLALEFVQDNIDVGTMQEVKDRALAFLLDA